MYTDASRYFEDLLREFDRKDYQTPFRNRVRPALDYFHKQSLCDLDRRANHAELKKRWTEFLVAVKGTPVLEKLSFNPSMRYSIETFIGIPSTKPYVPNTPPKSQKSPFEGLEPQHLIEHLIRKSNSRPRITEDQARVIKLGLFYLQAEATRARNQRNHSRIKEVWLTIHPLLQQAGFLTELSADKDAVKRIRLFISNKVF